METSKRHLGDISRNDQILVARTDRAGTDHMQYVWVPVCAQRSDGVEIAANATAQTGRTFTIANARNAKVVRQDWPLRI